MASKVGGFFATLMLSIPISAVGLMAIFGVPQFAPGNGSPGDEQLIRDPFQRSAQAFQEVTEFWSSDTASPESDGSRFDQQRSGDAPTWNGNRDEVAGQMDRSRFAYASESLAGGDSARPGDRMLTHEQDSMPTRSQAPDSNRSFPRADRGLQHLRTADVRPPASVPRLQSVPAGSSRLISWREASLRLSEIGIEKYHLERGSAEGTFLFVCLFTPGDAPHVTHRFEAEADDPLLAVNQALAQIDSWLGERFAADKFPVAQSNL